MVDLIRRAYRPPVGKNTQHSVPASEKSQTYNDDRAGDVYVVTKERRKKRDRRSHRDYRSQQDYNPRKGRALFDMRSGPGRRKEDRKHTISTKV